MSCICCDFPPLVLCSFSVMLLLGTSGALIFRRAALDLCDVSFLLLNFECPGCGGGLCRPSNQCLLVWYPQPLAAVFWQVSVLNACSPLMVGPVPWVRTHVWEWVGHRSPCSLAEGGRQRSGAGVEPWFFGQWCCMWLRLPEPGGCWPQGEGARAGGPGTWPILVRPRNCLWGWGRVRQPLALGFLSLTVGILVGSFPHWSASTWSQR